MGHRDSSYHARFYSASVRPAPSPRAPHQLALSELEALLRPYVSEHQLGWLVRSPADIELDPRTLVQPDLFVTSKRAVKTWEDAQPQRLAIEVLSPSTARADRFVKRRRFQRAGIPEHWIVALDVRLVERWRPGDERLEVAAERLEWQPEPSLPPLVLDLVALFREVHAEE